MVISILNFVLPIHIYLFTYSTQVMRYRYLYSRGVQVNTEQSRIMVFKAICTFIQIKMTYTSSSIV